ncbi:MAG: hypothetical protein EU536_03250 [Promethearchaeota archaeon]|nr:MAG: hypothetical protein EU536_03250 [Candidatus Lokiarchaeota archaeon]
MSEEYYAILAKKLDATLQGLSRIGTQGNVSETWMEYLRTLIPKEDIKDLIELPVFPGTLSVRKFAKKINKNEEEATAILQRLFHNDAVMRVGKENHKYGIHLPFLIFDVPPLNYENMHPEKAKKLAELSYQYLVEEEWYRNFEGSPGTPLSRIIPVQKSINTESEVLPYEKVEEIVKSARILSIQECACRKRLEYLGGRKCDHPLESCIGVNQGAQYFIDRGHAREISKQDALKLLKELNERGLVHTTENFGEGDHTLICNCCACCCNLIGGITRWDNPRAVAKANFIASPQNLENCTLCHTCIEICNFNAISIKDDYPYVDSTKCMGCGVCVVNCPSGVFSLDRKQQETIYSNLIELGLKVAKETNRTIKF